MHVAQQVEEGWQQVALAAGKQAAHAAAKGPALARALPRQLQRGLQLLKHAPVAGVKLKPGTW